MITSTTYDSKTVGELLRDIESSLIALPRYQRDVVWPLEKKRRLIDSVRNGFPIGSLLLAEIDLIIDGVAHKAWRIIDGLQRTSTFQDYVSDPKRYIEKSWVDSEWVSIAADIVLISTGMNLDSDSLRHALFEFMLLPSASRDRLKLFSLLAKSSETEVQKFIDHEQEITALASSLIGLVSAALDIENKKISVIKFVGSPEDQATAFEVLNTGSVQLNKYEIAASIWRKPCNVSNDELTNQIKKYWKDRLANLQLEIDGIAEDGTPETLMLFDVLVGVGRLITEKNPLLFKSDWGETIGFQLAAIVNKLRLSSINSIEDRFPLSEDRLALDVDEFVKTAIAASTMINIALRPILDLKLTARSVKTQFQDHSALQMCSFVAAIMIEALDEDGKWSKQIPARTAAEERSLANWYLIDRLRGEWGNAGDSTLFNRVWKSVVDDENQSTFVANSIYKSSPDLRMAELALDNWFEEETTKSHREREIISSETKLLLRYFYSKRVVFFDNHAATFQIDHLVPIDFWKKFFSKVPGDGLPINGIGNLCLMNTEDHNTKGIKLPTKWFESDVINFPAARITRAKDQYFLVPVDEFAYATSAQGLLETDGMDESASQVVRAAFKQQSRDRWNLIRKAVLEDHFS